MKMMKKMRIRFTTYLFIYFKYTDPILGTVYLGYLAIWILLFIF